MATKSIVGRFLILAVLIVSLGIVAQAAVIIMQSGGKKPPIAAAMTPAPAVPAATASASAPLTTGGADPVRVVYPGPLGDAPIQLHKIADAAPASPLDPAAAAQPQPAAKIGLAMAVTATPELSAPAPTSPQPAADPQPVATLAPPPAAPPSPPPSAPASVDVASLGSPPAAKPAPTGGVVNINSASVEVLNHLGGGHIGQSIAKHRPYHSVEDLVRKRVIRRSVYEQIKAQIAAE